MPLAKLEPESLKKIPWCKPSKPYPPLEAVPYTFEPEVPDTVDENGQQYKCRSWFELAQYDELDEKTKQELKAKAASPEALSERNAIRKAEKKKRLQEAKASGSTTSSDSTSQPTGTVNAKKAKRRAKEQAKKEKELKEKELKEKELKEKGMAKKEVEAQDTSSGEENTRDIDAATSDLTQMTLGPAPLPTPPNTPTALKAGETK